MGSCCSSTSIIDSKAQSNIEKKEEGTPAIDEDTNNIASSSSSASLELDRCANISVWNEKMPIRKTPSFGVNGTIVRAERSGSAWFTMQTILPLTRRRNKFGIKVISGGYISSGGCVGAVGIGVLPTLESEFVEKYFGGNSASNLGGWMIGGNNPRPALYGKDWSPSNYGSYGCHDPVPFTYGVGDTVFVTVDFEDDENKSVVITWEKKKKKKERTCWISCSEKLTKTILSLGREDKLFPCISMDGAEIELVSWFDPFDERIGVFLISSLSTKNSCLRNAFQAWRILRNVAYFIA